MLTIWTLNNSQGLFTTVIHPLEFLDSLLKLSDFFIVEDGQAWALSQLRTHPDMDFSTKLHFCQIYKLESWLEPAFRELMTWQIEDILPKDADHIPRRIWNTYVAAKSEITRHRHALAFEAPPGFNHPLCKTTVECGYRWEKAWFDGPVKMLCHPDRFYSMDDIWWALRTTTVPNICKACYELNVDRVKASAEWEGEVRIVDRKIMELKAWLAGL